MGGRGASSGSYKWKGEEHTYGDEYETLYEYRNIKFIKVKSGSATAPMETRMQGRVYVTINYNGSIKSITYFTGSGYRHKQVDLDHPHTVDGSKIQPHSHLGYTHEEYGTRKLSKKEKKMIAKVVKIWNNKNGK